MYNVHHNLFKSESFQINRLMLPPRKFSQVSRMTISMMSTIVKGVYDGGNWYSFSQLVDPYPTIGSFLQVRPNETFYWTACQLTTSPLSMLTWSKSSLLLFCLSWNVLVFVSGQYASTYPSPIPLVIKSPYFNIWIASDGNLTTPGVWPKFFSGPVSLDFFSA
jgi:hypothetical protein